MLRRAANEVERSPESTGHGRTVASLGKADVARFERRIKRLQDEFRATDAPDGIPYAVVTAMYVRPDA